MDGPSAAPVFFESAAAFRAWLEANGATASEVVVGFHKVGTGRGGMTYPQAVDEALCFGWIDGVRHSLGPDAYTNRFTPRRKKSIWSRVNVKRVGELEAEGRMTPAGRAAFEARTDGRTGLYSAEQGEIELDAESLAALRASESAWQFWEKAPKSYRRPATWWVISAKRPETREKRLRELIECSERGERVPPLRPSRRA